MWDVKFCVLLCVATGYFRFTLTMWDVKARVISSIRAGSARFTLTMWDVKPDEPFRLQKLYNVLP